MPNSAETSLGRRWAHLPDSVLEHEIRVNEGIVAHNKAVIESAEKLLDEYYAERNWRRE